MFLLTYPSETRSTSFIRRFTRLLRHLNFHSLTKFVEAQLKSLSLRQTGSSGGFATRNGMLQLWKGKVMTRRTPSQSVTEVPEPDWVAEMRAYYLKTGTYRQSDLDQVLGKPWDA